MNLKRLENTYLPVLLFLMILTVIGCKKDAITVETNKTYSEIKVAPPTNPMYSSAMVVSLLPGG